MYLGAIVVVIVAVGIGFGLDGVLFNGLSINWFAIITGLLSAGILFIAGGIFSRNHNQDRDTNGEIETILQSFCDKRSRLTWMAKAGKDVQREIDHINRQEQAFRGTIEYGVVTDGSENYYSYSYKKGK